MKKLTIFCAFLAMSGTGALLWQRHGLSQIRTRASEPNAFSSMADDKTADTVLQQEIAALREQTKDLAKLRNEVSQRREVRSDLAAARSENARLLEAKQTGALISREPPPGFVSRDNLTFAGYATPEATLQSLFWALRDGDMMAAMRSMPVDDEELVRLEKMPAQERARIEEEFKSDAEVRLMKQFNDFAVVSREDISDDEVVLHIRSSVATNTFPHALKRFGSEWKITALGTAQMSRRKNRP